MPVSWGSVWCHVKHNNPSFNGTILLDKYPSFAGGVDKLGNESTSVFFPEIEGFTFIVCDSELEAKRAAKAEILKLTGPSIKRSIDILTDTELKSDEIKFELKDPKLADDLKSQLQLKLNEHLAFIKLEKSRLKQLRQTRRAKIYEFTENHLKNLLKHKL